MEAGTRASTTTMSHSSSQSASPRSKNANLSTSQTMAQLLALTQELAEQLTVQRRVVGEVRWGPVEAMKTKLDMVGKGDSQGLISSLSHKPASSNLCDGVLDDLEDIKEDNVDTMSSSPLAPSPDLSPSQTAEATIPLKTYKNLSKSYHDLLKKHAATVDRQTKLEHECRELQSLVKDYEVGMRKCLWGLRGGWYAAQMEKATLRRELLAALDEERQSKLVPVAEQHELQNRLSHLSDLVREALSSLNPPDAKPLAGPPVNDDEIQIHQLRVENASLRELLGVSNHMWPDEHVIKPSISSSSSSSASTTSSSSSSGDRFLYDVDRRDPLDSHVVKDYFDPKRSTLDANSSEGVVVMGPTSEEGAPVMSSEDVVNDVDDVGVVQGDINEL
ncbi:hypothetical protein BZG36_03873 [Bifiguratus adelaidae]|uniref:Uncharacterized protein n=1 Tax=Bifiguratus adelaidae TaxID=1938954 RepID=A0A261XXN5_9FUNG|nr:hypothetical protein BZG36_03873 [Bifiguratus adelaidae]